MHAFSGVGAVVGSTFEFARDVRRVVDDCIVLSAVDAGRCALVARWVAIAVMQVWCGGGPCGIVLSMCPVRVGAGVFPKAGFTLRQERPGS